MEGGWFGYWFDNYGCLFSLVFYLGVGIEYDLMVEDMGFGVRLI